MHKLITLAAAATFALSGCVVHSYDNEPDVVVVVPGNYAPVVLSADAGVYYDAFNADDIWYFEAEVDDADGVLDVVAVWADVYDDYDGALVESFELFPTNDPYFWYSDWLGGSTYLDPFYRGYSVDIIAYDSYEAQDAVSLLPLVY